MNHLHGILPLTQSLLELRAGAREILADYLEDRCELELARLVKKCPPTTRELVNIALRITPVSYGLYCTLAIFRECIQEAKLDEEFNRFLQRTQQSVLAICHKTLDVSSLQSVAAFEKFIGIGKVGLADEVFTKSNVKFMEWETCQFNFLEPMIESMRLSQIFFRLPVSSHSVEITRRRQGAQREFQKLAYASSFIQRIIYQQRCDYLKFSKLLRQRPLGFEEWRERQLRAIKRALKDIGDASNIEGHG